jgi:photosystem II stability/assembly factor-like uncharacterized protein
MRIAPFVLLLLAARAAAAPVDPALFQELHWRSIGPFRGGRVLAVAGVPGEREHFYFGAVNGGIWETLDAGRTWRPIFDGQPIGTIGALALAPSNPKIVYAGSGEADMRSDIAQGDGVYKSSDGGKSWVHVGLVDSQQIGRILVHPRDPNRVLVAALGHPYGPNPERGVFLSSDGGKSWQRVLHPDDDTGAIDLAFKPGDPNVVWAALWQTRRPPWHVYPPANGPGSGLYRSSDGGRSWTQVRGRGLPERPGRIGLAVSPMSPRRLYLLIDADQGGLYRSDDDGASFTRVSADPRILERGWYFGGITVDPARADTVYACNTSMYVSNDGGHTFAPVKGAPGGDDYHELWIDAQHPERRILATDQGAVVTLNAGATWSSWYNQPTAQFYRLAVDNRFPYWVYGSQQDSGAAAIPSRTALTRDGINMTHFHEITAGGENDAIAPDPRDPDLIYGGRVEVLDLRTDQTRTIAPPLALPDHYRGTWTLPLVFSPRDPSILYFANQRLFRTANGGQSWTAISPDLTRAEPGAPPTLDPTTAADDGGVGPRRGAIFTVAPSPLREHDLWLGTDDGLVWRSLDEGAHWSDVTPRDLTPWSKVAHLEVSRFDPETAWAAVDRHRLDDFAPYVYRTRDGGKSWTLVVNGIAPGHFVNAVREDPVRRNLLYAGTEKGVVVSFDGGDHWQRLQLELPTTSVRDLAVKGDDVVIATHGRGFYILDDVTPLRQLDDEAQRADVFLFAPATVVRVRPAGFTGTPLPKDEPIAANPPFGAVIDYTLRRAPAGPITLTILDAAGATVRRYRSDDKPPQLSKDEKLLAPEWLEAHRALPATPGMHRAVWPLRYAAPPELAEGHGEWAADGVWAPPGTYTVVLEVDGRKLTRPLTVVPDPRLKLSPDVYQRQFELARRVERARAARQRADKEAKALHEALGQRTGDAAAAELDGKLMAIAEIRDPDPRRDPPPPKSLASLRALDDVLDKLAAAIDGADGDPTPDARAGLEQAEKTLAATLAAWDALKQRAAPPR